MASWSDPGKPRQSNGYWLIAVAFVAFLAWTAAAIAWRLGGGA